MLSLLGHRLFSFSPKFTRLAFSACALALSMPAHAANWPHDVVPGRDEQWKYALPCG